MSMATGVAVDRLIALLSSGHVGGSNRVLWAGPEGNPKPYRGPEHLQGHSCPARLVMLTGWLVALSYP